MTRPMTSDDLERLETMLFMVFRKLKSADQTGKMILTEEGRRMRN